MAEDSIDLNLRARYDRRAGVFRLTAADPRLQGLPFQITLSRGSESVDTLLKLFPRKSAIEAEDGSPSRPDLLKSSDYPQATPKQKARGDGPTSAIFVGPAAVGDALMGLKRDWEFQHHQSTLEDFERNLSEGKISKEISVVLIADIFFNLRSDSELFTKTVARLAPHALVAVVSYRPHFRSEIVVKVAEYCYEHSMSSAPFYFVDSKRPLATLDEAVEDFLSRDKLAADARQGLRNSRLDGAKSQEELPSGEPKLNPVNGAVVVGYSELMERLGVPAFDELGNRRSLTVDPNS